MYDFLDAGLWLPVKSSNVDQIRYDEAAQTIYVEYLSGAQRDWKYWPYSRSEALAFATAPSTGVAVWDMMRVRGPGNKHQHQRGAAAYAELHVQAVVQLHSWDCGPAAIGAVAQYFGVPFSGQVEGASEEDGTPPEAVLNALEQLGLRARAIERMSLAQLDQAIRSGHPVLICLQALGTQEEMDAVESGHWSLVTGSTPAGFTLTDSVKGKVTLSRQELQERWVDKDGDDRIYPQLGIVVSA